MIEANDLFKKSVKILNDNNINYWICHGTLLGIIRDNKLLPWDHDIDFAIWEHEYSKEDILKIFTKENGFKQEIVLEEINSLHFSTDNKRVDINFYSKNKDKAFIKWAVLPQTLLNKINYFIISFIAGNIEIAKAVKSSNGKIVSTIKYLMILPLLLLRKILSNSLKEKLLKSSYERFDIIGYSYPLNLMDFKEIDFIGIKIKIPKKPEETLQFTYGDDWKIPKKNYVWYKEANNLFQQN